MSGNKLVDLLNQFTHEHTILETNKTVQIKPITTGQMKSILQYEGADDPSVIDTLLDDIINGCVVSDGFNVDELTLQDRFELLIGIRKVSKGNMYSFNIKCPKCKTESIQGIDLNDLDILPFPEEIEQKVKINDNLFLKLGFIRRGHQKEAVVFVDGMSGLTDTQKRSEIATYMYAFGIVGVETKVGSVDSSSVEDRKDFLDNLSANAYEGINDWYRKYNYGTQFKYRVMCKAGDCDFNKEEDLPITGFFF